ncbi:MAG: bifunctional nicotinamidase/pyrazinamidase [Betaproteobacteria bacterium]|nr:bifunctional nicotinamidase/pyrazinamidase [Betaproteobacteria bacterium]
MNVTQRRSFLLGGAALAGLAAAQFSGVRNVFAAHHKVKITPTDALIAIDVQNCFMPGGSLPVAKGDEVVPLINALAGRFKCVVMTQDWHPAKHASFASTHGKDAFSVIEMPYGPQVMWPDHCVQNTEDANLHSSLDLTKANLILRKGFNPDVDGYSAFYDNDKKSPTGLAAYLKARGVKRVFMTGLATDFCVMWSSVDARKDGFECVVIEDACRGIDVRGSLAAGWKEMEKAGCKRIQSADLVSA